MSNWYHCDNITKEIVTGGITQEGVSQEVPSGLTEYIIPGGLIGSAFSGAPDFTGLKTYLKNQINDSFSAYVSPEVSDNVILHDLFLAYKQEEAAAWTLGDEITNPSNYPFMLGELQARLASGLSADITSVHTGIIAELAAAVALPLLEGTRVARRALVGAGTNLPDIWNAAIVDWDAVVASL